MTRWLPAILLASCACAVAPLSGIQVPGLGVSTRAPTDYEGQCWELLRTERWQGRVVETIAPGGPADLAGIRTGDVITQVGDVELYSQDDLSDYLRVTGTGERVAVRLKRKDDAKEEALSVTLGPTPTPAGFRWQYASLGQLSAALTEAEKTRKSVLIGLSGAET